MEEYRKKTTAAQRPSDPEAIPQLVALYRRLKEKEGRKVLFGQQDAYVCGVTFEANREENLGKTDILSAAGVYPAVAGFDVGHLEVYYTARRDPEFAKLIRGKDRTGSDFEEGKNIDNIEWGYMRKAIQLAHEKGAVVTISWHSVNPLTGGEYGDNTAWTESVVADVLPGGSLNSRFRLYLDAFAAFNETLTDREGNLIPYIFRPFHEHSGDWFWWGIDSSANPNDGTAWSGDGGRLNAPADFAALYRYTVEYLRGKGVHNVLYCISPDMSRIAYEGDQSGYNEAMAQAWMTGYPGDDYIDVFGLDNYWNVGHAYNRDDSRGEGMPVLGEIQYNRYTGALETLTVLAQEHGKFAALTEMGLANEKVLSDTGRDIRAAYTEWFLRAVKTNKNTRRILYGLVWRSDFLREDADPFAVYEYSQKDPADAAKGVNRILWYSRKEDFQKFVEDEFTYWL